MVLCGVLLLSAAGDVHAQPGSSPGDVRVVAPSSVQRMLAEHQRINRENGVMAGFRIQIYASPIMSKCKDARATFQQSFPDIPSDVVLEQPDFKLLAGHYIDRFDAHRDLQRIVSQYPGAFLVRQLVAIADL